MIINQNDKKQFVITASKSELKLIIEGLHDLACELERKRRTESSSKRQIMLDNMIDAIHILTDGQPYY